MFFWCFILVLNVEQVTSAQLDPINCGVDNDMEVHEGDVEITRYPWLGVLYYSFEGEEGEARAVTTVALIHMEFVIAPAEDIGPMPKHNFRANTQVLLGQDWFPGGRKVRHYVVHPEYEQTYNTIALVQLETPIRNAKIKPICPPPVRLRNPDLYVVKFTGDYNNLQKQVLPVTYVPANLCKEFYVRANLYARKMRPPHVACAVSLEEESVCVWDAGGALVTRDVWGRWQLLGLGVRGPGCGAPSRYLDMMSYYPWIEDSLDKFRRISISKISKQKYILRSSHAFQRFGNCDPEEKRNLVYREKIILKTDNNLYQFMTYNLTLKEDIEYTCLTIELINASATSEMRIHHYFRREARGPPCYQFSSSVFDISVYLMFSDECLFEMVAWGYKKMMKSIDIQEWKWEEGTYYEQFSMTPVEYRGPSYQTEFGFEPVDLSQWVPDYDVWSTTEYVPPTTTRKRISLEGPPPARVDTKYLPLYTKKWTTRPTKPAQWVDFVTAKPYDKYGHRPYYGSTDSTNNTHTDVVTEAIQRRHDDDNE